MTTASGSNRTITGYLFELLEYPRWLIARDVDFTHCAHSGHHNQYLAECINCPFGKACRWLTGQTTLEPDTASIEELADALDSAIDYVADSLEENSIKHKRDCSCESCNWLRKARQFVRQKSTAHGN